jgi:hypothetical protein
MGIFDMREANPPCAECGENDADKYLCDECGKVFCTDCAPHRTDDAPWDVCMPCVEAIQEPTHAK